MISVSSADTGKLELFKEGRRSDELGISNKPDREIGAGAFGETLTVKALSAPAMMRSL